MIDTLTWDRGTEMAAHRSFTVATDVAVYFCDPKSPWQRAPSLLPFLGSGYLMVAGVDVKAFHKRFDEVSADLLFA
jgi:hypothetical protein